METKKVGAGFGVLVIRDGMVLLGKRHVDPAKADSLMHGEGTWTMPGGKFDFGESFEDGAAREVLEETGVTISPNDLKVISLSNEVVHDAHFVTVGLLCEKYIGEASVMEPDEITEWEWFPLNELPTPMFKPSVKILENYKEGVIYKK